jgi:hypothetical protein
VAKISGDVTAGGRDNDKERAYGGPKVERQIFGIFLNCFVILFSFAGALRGERGKMQGEEAGHAGSASSHVHYAAVLWMSYRANPRLPNKAFYSLFLSKLYFTD